MTMNDQGENEPLQNAKADAAEARHSRNLSEADQLAAVRKDGRAIRGIDNPSEAVQLAAVQQNFWCVQHIDAPAHAVQIAVTEFHVLAIGACSEFFSPSFPELMKALRAHGFHPNSFGGGEAVEDASRAYARVIGAWPKEQREEAIKHLSDQIKTNQTFQILMQRRELSDLVCDKSQRARGARPL